MKPLKIIKKQWETIESHGKILKTMGKQWTPLKPLSNRACELHDSQTSSSNHCCKKGLPTKFSNRGSGFLERFAKLLFCKMVPTGTANGCNNPKKSDKKRDLERKGCKEFAPQASSQWRWMEMPGQTKREKCVVVAGLVTMAIVHHATLRMHVSLNLASTGLRTMLPWSLWTGLSFQITSSPLSDTSQQLCVFWGAFEVGWMPACGVNQLR